MLCQYMNYANSVMTYSYCDASDDTVLSNGNVTHDAALAAGWKLVGSGCITQVLMEFIVLFSIK